MENNNMIRKVRKVCVNLYLWCLAVAVAGNITAFISSNSFSKLSENQERILSEITESSEQFSEMKMEAYYNYKALYETEGYYSVGTPQDYMNYLNSDNYKEKVLDKLTDVDVSEYYDAKNKTDRAEIIQDVSRNVYTTLTASTLALGFVNAASNTISEGKKEKELEL